MALLVDHVHDVCNGSARWTSFSMAPVLAIY